MPLSEFPKKVLCQQLTKEGLYWSGDMHLSALPRLQQESKAISQKQLQDNSVFIDMHLSLDDRSDGMYAFKLKASGEISLECQRCLQPVMQDFAVDVELMLLEDEKLTTLTVDEEDYVLLNEVSYFDQKYGLDLIEVIEDELLLSLPISPKHEECDAAVTLVDIDDVVPETQTDNPFSVLAQLKDK